MERVFSISLVAALLLGWLATAMGDDYRDVSFDQKARDADLVIIGRVVSTEGGPQYARVKATTVLKGRTPEAIKFVVETGISEMDPYCCTEVGRSYLFFLHRLKNGAFESVRGHFGVFPIREGDCSDHSLQGRDVR